MHVLKYPEDLQSHPFASPEKSALSLTKKPAHFGISNFYFSDIFHGSVAFETIKLMGHHKNIKAENVMCV